MDHGQKYAVFKLTGFIFSLVLLITSQSWARQSLSGTIKTLGSIVFIQTSELSKPIELVPKTTEIKNVLNRLDINDPIICSGSQLEEGKFQVESIDFVGLRKLLGSWINTSSQGFIRFDNFLEVTMDMGIFSAKSLNRLTRYQTVKYTISPADQGWVIFVSNNMQTLIGTIDLNDKSASLKFYDGISGDLIADMNLIKLYE